MEGGRRVTLDVYGGPELPFHPSELKYGRSSGWMYTKEEKFLGGGKRESSCGKGPLG